MKYAYINFGMISMAIQGCIILAFALVFRKIESCMYAIICSFITNKIVDLMLYGPATSRQCYIISERSDRAAPGHCQPAGQRRHPPGGEGGLVGAG